MLRDSLLESGSVYNNLYKNIKLLKDPIRFFRTRITCIISIVIGMNMKYPKNEVFVPITNYYFSNQGQSHNSPVHIILLN